MAAIERRYAKALIDSLNSIEEKSQVDNDLRQVANLFVTNIEFKKILLDPRLDLKVKSGVIKELLVNANPMLINFLNLLIDKNRITYLSGISKEYSELVRILNDEIFIKIISASELSEAEINGISDKYKKIYNVSAVKYDVLIDESLIGGVKVIVGNKIYDGSVRTQLRNML